MSMNFHVQPHWTFEDALPLIRAIQPQVRIYRYHLALGGGVLNNGKSDKDLDLYFLPMHMVAKGDWQGLLGFLERSWGKYEILGKDYPETDLYAIGAKFKYGGLRIDAFVIGETEEAKAFREKRMQEERDAYEERVEEIVNRPLLTTTGRAVMPITEDTRIRGTGLGGDDFQAFLQRQRQFQEDAGQRARANVTTFRWPTTAATATDNAGTTWTFPVTANYGE